MTSSKSEVKFEMLREKGAYDSSVMKMHIAKDEVHEERRVDICGGGQRGGTQ
jgi:hypothetical protein